MNELLSFLSVSRDRVKSILGSMLLWKRGTSHILPHVLPVTDTEIVFQTLSHFLQTKWVLKLNFNIYSKILLLSGSWAISCILTAKWKACMTIGI